MAKSATLDRIITRATPSFLAGILAALGIWLVLQPQAGDSCQVTLKEQGGRVVHIVEGTIKR
jgi:hypothetical protein